MAEQSRGDRSDDWAPRGVMQGLLWWPPVAFVLAIALPAAEMVWIVVSGLALAATGAAMSLVSRRLQARHTAPADDRTAPQAAPTTPSPAVELAPHPTVKAA